MKTFKTWIIVESKMLSIWWKYWNVTFMLIRFNMMHIKVKTKAEVLWVTQRKWFQVLWLKQCNQTMISRLLFSLVSIGDFLWIYDIITIKGCKATALKKKWTLCGLDVDYDSGCLFCMPWGLAALALSMWQSSIQAGCEVCLMLGDNHIYVEFYPHPYHGSH